MDNSKRKLNMGISLMLNWFRGHEGNQKESKQDDSNGDLVPLVWMIEKLRRQEGGCIMNELVAEIKKNFSGIDKIKHKTIKYNG